MKKIGKNNKGSMPKSTIVREMTNLWDSQLNPSWIMSRLRFLLKASDVTHALQVLFDLGLLIKEVGPDNKVQLGHSRLQTTQDMASEGIKRFHEEMIELSKRSLRQVEVEQRHVSSSTFAIKKENIKKGQRTH